MRAAAEDESLLDRVFEAYTTSERDFRAAVTDFRDHFSLNSVLRTVLRPSVLNGTRTVFHTATRLGIDPYRRRYAKQRRLSESAVTNGSKPSRRIGPPAEKVANSCNAQGTAFWIIKLAYEHDRRPSAEVIQSGPRRQLKRFAPVRPVCVRLCDWSLIAQELCLPQPLRVDVYGVNWLQRSSLILGMLIETAKIKKCTELRDFREF